MHISFYSWRKIIYWLMFVVATSFTHDINGNLFWHCLRRPSCDQIIKNFSQKVKLIKLCALRSVHIMLNRMRNHLDKFSFRIEFIFVFVVLIFLLFLFGFMKFSMNATLAILSGVSFHNLEPQILLICTFLVLARFSILVNLVFLLN